MGSSGPEGLPGDFSYEKGVGVGARKSQNWKPISSMGGIITTCPRLASNWVPNELELFTLYQNNLWWQLCLMTNFLCHFTLCLPWSSVRFPPLEEKNMYIKSFFFKTNLVGYFFSLTVSICWSQFKLPFNSECFMRYCSAQGMFYQDGN